MVVRVFEVGTKPHSCHVGHLEQHVRDPRLLRVVGLLLAPVTHQVRLIHKMTNLLLKMTNLLHKMTNVLHKMTTLLHKMTNLLPAPPTFGPSRACSSAGSWTSWRAGTTRRATAWSSPATGSTTCPRRTSCSCPTTSPRLTSHCAWPCSQRGTTSLSTTCGSWTAFSNTQTSAVSLGCTMIFSFWL